MSRALADAIRAMMGPLECVICAETIPRDAPRSVADDDTVWCADCYETAGPAEQEQRPKPGLPQRR